MRDLTKLEDKPETEEQDSLLKEIDEILSGALYERYLDDIVKGRTKCTCLNTNFCALSHITIPSMVQSGTLYKVCGKNVVTDTVARDLNSPYRSPLKLRHDDKIKSFVKTHEADHVIRERTNNRTHSSISTFVVLYKYTFKHRKAAM